MSRKRKIGATGAMLELWRPPQGAGDAIGCVTTTYTFSPAIFDEQCLARFLDIGSEPDREDLPFLLERESRLQEAYAGVLVDHTQAGVAHSLRWDVLPVRVPGAKQHAKLSLLVWASHVRVIVSSANLTEYGYRFNQEVAGAVDLTPRGGDIGVLTSSLDFLQVLLEFVPGPAAGLPVVERAQAFLEAVRKQTEGWRGDRRKNAVRQHLVVTAPERPKGDAARSSLVEAVGICRRGGGSPTEAWVASPFFDADQAASQVSASLCKLLARGWQRSMRLCVPAPRDEPTGVVRLPAPRALLDTPSRYDCGVTVELLPQQDGDRNARPWHAKMLALRRPGEYSALMIGSSNFTCAGLGLFRNRNTEANLLTTVTHEKFARESGALDSLWPDTEALANPEAAEWRGFEKELVEEERAPIFPVPPGFLSATFRAGSDPQVILHVDPAHLPDAWSLWTGGPAAHELVSSSTWHEREMPRRVQVAWGAVQPPETLIVRWEEYEAILALNVEDARELPPPSRVADMTAHDMLGVLAATDPSAAFRAWVKRLTPLDGFDDELDAAMPIDLDPLRRFDLQATFLHRVRRRARVLASLRANLERPVWSRKALEWRLMGFIGVQAVAERLVNELGAAVDGHADEALLTLADFLMVVREVDYKGNDGGLSRQEFNRIHNSFLRGLAQNLSQQVEQHQGWLSKAPVEFWQRVVTRCLA
jgi:hypothetical protein